MKKYSISDQKGKKWFFPLLFGDYLIAFTQWLGGLDQRLVLYHALTLRVMANMSIEKQAL